ncbi:hypothetical protein [Paenibacillus profundus]|uniref:hypothetical protein n=1 Tax=Paenibacillus profundus TaxID=1173085 RepID=UPI001F48B967|nr:hypothetical protein [Paenibacillus profundus]
MRKLHVMVIGSLCMLMLVMTACQSVAGKGIASEPPDVGKEDECRLWMKASLSSVNLHLIVRRSTGWKRRSR